MLDAFKNKIANKLSGVVHVKARGDKKGNALLSYITLPFTMAPWEHPTDPHSSYWECAHIAELLSERGYDVDIINWNNNTFVPRKKYAVCIDIQKNIQRLAPHLPHDCIKIMHVVSSYAEFQNKAEEERLRALNERRSTALKSHRKDMVSDNPKYADYLEGFGNETVRGTYGKYRKTIFPIPISVVKEFEFPEDKDFGTAKNNFLWFGGGGAVHKGLDLVLESFSRLPHLTLHVVGPVEKETEFVSAYKNEFYDTLNIRLYERPKVDSKGELWVKGRKFKEILDLCGAIIYPSCSEGTSGAVVQAMHAGVYPIVTKETGLYESAPATLITPSIEAISNEIKLFSQKSDSEIRDLSRNSWSFARSHYTRQAFSQAYSKFLDMILKNHGAQ